MLMLFILRFNGLIVEDYLSELDEYLEPLAPGAFIATGLFGDEIFIYDDIDFDEERGTLADEKLFWLNLFFLFA